jgi:hypothetical protein
MSSIRWAHHCPATGNRRRWQERNILFTPWDRRIPVAAAPDLARPDYRMETDLTIPPAFQKNAAP